MQCLRCGYCCIYYSVIILDADADEGVSYKDCGTPCKHLSIAEGIATCHLHDEPRYEETPCAEFTQIESHTDSPCRIGKAIRNAVISPDIPVNLVHQASGGTKT